MARLLCLQIQIVARGGNYTQASVAHLSGGFFNGNGTTCISSTIFKGIENDVFDLGGTVYSLDDFNFCLVVNLL